MSYKVDTKARVLGCFAIVLMLVLLPLGYLAGGPYTEAFPRPFSSEKWKAADIASDTRCAMMADLRFRVGLIGRTRSDVIGMLGRPEEDDADPDPYVSHWPLCLSFMDVWIVEVQWHKGRIAAAWVRDT